ncbi:MAG: four helix bundle protein [Cyclobacteriaceae bacterium]
MGKIERFEDLPIWKKAAEISLNVYRISEKGKLKNDFSMKDQIKRAAISISSNIAEGFEYGNNSDFVRYLRYAKGSAGELRSQMYIINEMELVESADYQKINEQLIEVSKQISGFMKYLREHRQF